MILSVAGQNADTFLLTPNVLNSSSPSGNPIYTSDVIGWTCLLLLCYALIKISLYLYRFAYYSEESDKFLKGIIISIFITTFATIVFLLKLTIGFLQ